MKKLELDCRIENGTEMLYVWAGKYYIIPTQLLSRIGYEPLLYYYHFFLLSKVYIFILESCFILIVCF